MLVVDGWMDGWMDGCMDGWMDGWMDGFRDKHKGHMTCTHILHLSKHWKVLAYTTFLIFPIIKKVPSEKC
ncbi:unnamed protein product [Brugia pahangi]|uniref:Transmembrane protein n=1 Tax=Brugia pahangi TaxID=6280 RepID=A0A158PQW0_BRUPA|nr:unnamed protein product [Brugia pahangi]